jgi:hypothetical protein
VILVGGYWMLEQLLRFARGLFGDFTPFVR